MFKKILIANRGEIARRIILACKELGITAVAVFSDADEKGAWLPMADEVARLPGITAVETYLNQDKILAIALEHGVDAIHPGYGFLSENPIFATACAEVGIKFIGPTPQAMELLGNKARAREMAEQAGVPVVPGVDGKGMDAAELQTAVTHIEYPILIKASAGGGGKGMRVVWSADQFADALQAARSEALSAFGDAHILIEKYFTKIHHVEIQILADEQGNMLHLFERECSIQRRHQKIIEESPAPILREEALRQAMAAAAVQLATTAHYTNAGTVEFIVDGQGNFYFLEMNTRLQVEHPVTEMVTGLDLATWQIRIANGEALPCTQQEIQRRGHALECRLYAEDPANQFFPSIGKIAYYQRPSGPGVRVDDGIEIGAEVTPYYDPMLAKVITFGQTRLEAIEKMERALRDTAVLGVTTNLEYLLAILQEPNFRAGNTNTNYLSEHMLNWHSETKPSEDEWLAAAVFELLQGAGKGTRTTVADGQVVEPDPWRAVTNWRNVQLN